MEGKRRKVFSNVPYFNFVGASEMLRYPCQSKDSSLRTMAFLAPPPWFKGPEFFDFSAVRIHLMCNTIGDFQLKH